MTCQVKCFLGINVPKMFLKCFLGINVPKMFLPKMFVLWMNAPYLKAVKLGAVPIRLSKKEK